MDERHGTIRLADPGESEARGLVTTVPRAEVEQALQSDEPVDLLLDIERAVEGEGRETQRVALGWERQDLERLLENDGDITLTFDEAELQQLLDEDVEAHGMREKLVVLSVAAGSAAAGAGPAGAMVYAGSGGGGTAAVTPRCAPGTGGPVSCWGCGAARPARPAAPPAARGSPDPAGPGTPCRRSGWAAP